MFVHFIRAVFLAIFQSKQYLLKELRTYFENDKWAFSMQFSGRVAIKKITRSVSKEQMGSYALVPRYICNVVPMAVKEGGLEVIFYDTDNNFMPDQEQLSSLLEGYNIALLVICPLYGSDGGVSFLNEKSFIKYLNISMTTVLVDTCQNIEYMKELVSCKKWSYERTVYVCSFNNKNIPGVMGGGILSRHSDIYNYETDGQTYPPFKIFIYGLYKYILIPLKTILLGTRKKNLHSSTKVNFEFTVAKNFPYQLIDFQLSKLQIAFALLGIKKLPSYKKRQASFLKANKGRYLELPHVSTASHLIWIANKPPHGMQFKPSYALHDKKEISEKPELAIISNGGF